MGNAASIEGAEHVEKKDVHGFNGLFQAHEFGEWNPGRRDVSESTVLGMRISMLK